MLNRNEMDVVNYYTLVVGNKLLKDQRLIMRYSNRINSELKFLNLKKFILLNIKAKIFFCQKILSKRDRTHIKIKKLIKMMEMQQHRNMVFLLKTHANNCNRVHLKHF